MAQDINYGNEGTFNRLVSTLKSKLAKISLTGKLSDANNDMKFKPVIEVTKEQYDALPESKNYDGNLYAVKWSDSDEGQFSELAENVYFDDSVSKIGVNNVQLAIDKLNTDITNLITAKILYNYQTGTVQGVIDISFDIPAISGYRPVVAIANNHLWYPSIIAIGDSGAFPIGLGATSILVRYYSAETVNVDGGSYSVLILYCKL